MASILAVCTAGVIHVILQMSLFLSQMPDACSPAPHLASYLFAGTILVIAGNIPLFSERYSHLPYYVLFPVETLATMAILELFDIYVWCRMERFIHYIVRILFAVLGMDVETYLELEYWILMVPTTALVVGVIFITWRANLLKFKPVVKPRMNIHLNRECYMDMMAATIKKNNNRRLKKRTR